MDVSELMTCDAAAEELGVSVRTVWRYQALGQLPLHHVGHGRFTEKKAVARFKRNRDREQRQLAQ